MGGGVVTEDQASIDFEVELRDVLERMAGVVLAEVGVRVDEEVDDRDDRITDVTTLVCGKIGDMREAM